MVNGTGGSESTKNIREFIAKHGEPLQFCIEEGKAGAFLSHRSFSRIHNATPYDYKKTHFHGKNENRNVSTLLFFVHAVIE
jgi:O-methyltransferase involved in polyketide biosynthesis